MDRRHFSRADRLRVRNNIGLYGEKICASERWIDTSGRPITEGNLTPGFTVCALQQHWEMFYGTMRLLSGQSPFVENRFKPPTK